jgi:hypothetical protein
VELRRGLAYALESRARLRHHLHSKDLVTEMKAKGLEGGAEALLTKPIDFVTLRNEDQPTG